MRDDLLTAAKLMPAPIYTVDGEHFCCYCKTQNWFLDVQLHTDWCPWVALTRAVAKVELGITEFRGLSAVDHCYTIAANKPSVPADVVLAAIDELVAKATVIMQRCSVTEAGARDIWAASVVLPHHGELEGLYKTEQLCDSMAAPLLAMGHSVTKRRYRAYLVSEEPTDG